MEGDYQNQDDDCTLGCSDDEKYDMKLNEDGEWEPEASVIAELYDQIENNGYIEIEWQCPGRRPPTPQSSNDSRDIGDDKNSIIKTEEEDDKSDFEFKDEMSQLRLSVRPAENVGPRGSAKKKTTSLDAILSNMARHRKLDMMDQD